VTSNHEPLTEADLERIERHTLCCKGWGCDSGHDYLSSGVVADLRATRAKVEELEGDRDEWRKQLHAAWAENDALRQDLEQREAEVERLRRHVETRDAEVARIRGDCVTLAKHALGDSMDFGIGEIAVRYRSHD
jgi:outer membrane murein-binding lipoprotein Lpp